MGKDFSFVREQARAEGLVAVRACVEEKMTKNSNGTSGFLSAGASRRTVLKASGAFAAMLATPAYLRTTSALAAEPLIVASFGGSWAAAMTEAFHKPFTEETGVPVIVADGADLAKAKAQVQTGNIEWDIVELATGWLSSGSREGLWEPIDTSVVDVTGTSEGSQHENAIGFCSYSGCFAWNTERFKPGQHPTNWIEFFDAEKFPGRRGLMTRITGNLEYALMSDGVNPKELYPLDVERGFAALDRIKPHVTSWVPAMPQTISLLQNGEVDFCASAIGRVYAAQQQGIPLDYSREMSLVEVGKIAVLKGTKKRENAMKHLSFVMRPDRQLAFADIIGYAPSKLEAKAKMSDKLKALNPDPDGPLSAYNDEFWWEPRLADLTKRFKEWQLS